jgi:hypothetical protein
MNPPGYFNIVPRGVALHMGGVALATPKKILFMKRSVCIYIRLPQIINIELPQINLVAKISINNKVKKLLQD